MTDPDTPRPPIQGNPPTDDDLRALIRRADDHALGRDFLLHGALGAVAATFGVHAYVVDAVRDRLEREPTFA